VKLVKDLKDLFKSDVEIAGGKGASLGEMLNIGIPVPPGFVILSNAFEEFLKTADLNDEIDTILHSVNKNNIHTVEVASERIRELLLQAEIPEDTADDIQKQFKKLGAEFVAVRSSATAEDSDNTAWAGQLESYLNTTEGDLLVNIKKCWASLFTPRAIFYRFENDLHKQKISVAVVVQKMVKSEVSGVIFSVHPVIQDKNQMIIEAGFGLGESIVSGETTPDSYLIEKNNCRILDKNISNQNVQKLSDQEIIEISNLAMKIEEHFGFPVDIEWAKEKNNFYIVQCRPITTIIDTALDQKTVFDYIKSQKWFFGIRADESLLFYSMKSGGYDRIEQEYGIHFAETLLISLRKDYLMRVFNLSQAESFHAVSKEIILRRPRILSDYIERDDIVYEKIDSEGERLLSAITRDDYQESVRLFNKIISLYETARAHFIIIFSLGLKLAENVVNSKDVDEIIKKHDVWRNSVAFKEEKMGENLFNFLEYLVATKKSKIDPLLLMKFTTLNETKAWLKNEITDEVVRRKIRSRGNQGFIYLNLRDQEKEIIDDAKEIKEIQKYFLKLDKESKNSDEISGQVAYNPKKSIKGRIIIIKDKAELRSKNYLINGKILVAIQTTPHFIPYVRKVKAIITDEGGLTCHAAIIARELKIPCVVGTKTATQILKNNDFVEINTDNGVVRVIKR